MTVEVSTLANGLRVATSAMPHLSSVSLGVWVASGSRHETAAEHGISHMLEHMAFKGTEQRTARAIAEEIENVGGEINAATGVEATAYYARVLEPDTELALDLLADVLLHSRLEEAELAVERDVVLQEIAGTEDSPEDIVFELSEALAFPGQPIGRPILGTAETVSRMTTEGLRGFMDRHYRANRMVLCAAGAVDHGQVLAHAEALFGGLATGPGPVAAPARYEGGARSIEKSFEQAHLVLAFAGPSTAEPEALMTAQVLSTLLGGGASSRLFQEAREERGLCYGIGSHVTAFSDAGLFGIHAATSPEHVAVLVEVVCGELEATAGAGLGAAEVARARAQLKAGLLMGLESSGARAEQLARHLLVYGRPIPAAEIAARIDAVGLEDVRAMARRVFSGAKPVVAEVGAGVAARGFEWVWARLGGGG